MDIVFTKETMRQIANACLEIAKKNCYCDGRIPIAKDFITLASLMYYHSDDRFAQEIETWLQSHNESKQH